MRTSTQILPGIKSIGWIDCRLLPRRVDLSAICGMSVAILQDIHPIDFFDEPSCECVSVKENGGYKDTATLKFLAGVKLPRGIPTGFIVTDVNDKSYLIGLREHPHPKVQVTQQTGSPGGDSAGFAYEITHSSLKTLILCMI